MASTLEEYDVYFEAIKQGDLEMLRYLDSIGWNDENRLDNQGRTALELGEEMGEQNIILYLRERFFNIFLCEFMLREN